MRKVTQLFFLLLASSLIQGCGFLDETISDIPSEITCKLGDTWTQTLKDYQYLNLSTNPISAKLGPDGKVYITGVGDVDGDDKLATFTTTDGVTLKNIDYYTTVNVDFSVDWSFGRTIAFGRNGKVYVGGGIMSSDFATIHPIIRESSDGITWTTSNSPTSYAGRQFFSSGMDSSGNLYMLGGNGMSSGSIIHKLSASGGSWTPHYESASHASGSIASGLSEIANGNFFLFSDYAGQWKIRKSIDQGVAWTDSDDYFPVDSNYTAVNSGIVTSTGRILAVGYRAYATWAKYDWVVRKSDNNGDTWELVESWQYDPAHNKRSIPVAVFQHPDGSIYALGDGTDSDDTGYVVIKKSIDDGDTWSIHAKYKASDVSADGVHVQPAALVMDAKGNLLALAYTMSGANQDRKTHILKLPCE